MSKSKTRNFLPNLQEIESKIFDDMDDPDRDRVKQFYAEFEIDSLSKMLGYYVETELCWPFRWGQHIIKTILSFLQGYCMRVVERAGYGSHNVRSAPDLNSRIVRQINTTDVVAVLEEQLPWVRISSGWTVTQWNDITCLVEVGSLHFGVHQIYDKDRWTSLNVVNREAARRDQKIVRKRRWSEWPDFVQIGNHNVYTTLKRNIEKAWNEEKLSNKIELEVLGTL